MLYIINKSHTDSLALSKCLQAASATDVVLLIEHAVYAALELSQTPLAAMAGSAMTVYALSPDMQARGVQQAACLDFIQYVDYAGFVELVAANQPIRSCF